MDGTHIIQHNKECENYAALSKEFKKYETTGMRAKKNDMDKME